MIQGCPTPPNLQMVKLPTSTFKLISSTWRRPSLGIARGTAPEVKQHGEMVAKDHSGVITTFEGILMEHGIKPTAPSDNAATEQRHRAVIDSLKARSGTDFDREFITEAIIDHRAFIALVSETLLPTVKEPALAAHLKEVLPAVKKHLAMTIEASRKLNIPDQNDHGGRSCVRSLT